METLEFDYDTETGFAWITVNTDGSEDEWSVQCCLKEGNYDEENATQEYLEKIKMNDCGHDDGLCADGNEKAFKYWGENRCMKALFSAAKNNGIDVY